MGSSADECNSLAEESVAFRQFSTRFIFRSIMKYLDNTWYSGTFDMLCIIVSGRKIDLGKEDFEFTSFRCCGKVVFRAKRRNHVYPVCTTRSTSSGSPWRAHQEQPLHVAIFLLFCQSQSCFEGTLSGNIGTGCNKKLETKFWTALEPQA
ncbi:hypothetical protein QL285_019609 [Trifolium repens]|nr:hypothetical protein QL285_019609 [Trifolium repens]